MSDELKPCPFCNGEGVIYEYSTVETCPCSMRPARPAEAEGVEFPIARFLDHKRDGAEWMVRAVDHDAALSAVTAERDAANSRLHEVAVACATAEQERDQLRAEVEAMRPDAERYRWLREQCDINGNLTIAKCSEWAPEGWSGDDPDRAIDAAMAAKEA